MIALAEIEAARAADRRRRGAHAARAPADRATPRPRSSCKLETLQPINSFKIRGAANAVRSADRRERAARAASPRAPATWPRASPGSRRELGLPATIAVPEHAPEAKLAAIERLGGRVLKLPYDDWWNAIVTGRVEGVEGLFVHPVDDDAVMAGNGTIGLEILEDLPDVDAVVIPYGGGGLTVGIASALQALRPQTRIYTAEPETGAALAAALAAGRAGPTSTTRPSFVDGAGSRRVLDPMWPRLTPLVDDALAVPIADAAAAVRTLAERLRVIAEGAGALAPAAALAGARGLGQGRVRRLRRQHRPRQAGARSSKEAAG